MILETFFCLVLFFLSMGCICLIRNRSQSIDHKKLKNEVEADFSEEYGDGLSRGSDNDMKEIIKLVENENSEN